MKNIYVFPKFSSFDAFGLRVGGPGLGNILFPFARSIVLSKKYDLQRINPTWGTIKFGTMIRHEKDNRFYLNLFNNSFGISGINKIIILNISHKIYEYEITEDNLEKSTLLPKVIIFQGLKNFFNDILHDHQTILDELYKITREVHLQKVDSFCDDVIGVHIRLGDFTEARDSRDIQPNKNYRLPLSWYIEIINKIRKEVNRNIKVTIFSDGTEGELSQILKIHNVQKVFLGSAVSDLLALSKVKILITSGSTFSMWASYFGRMPTVWYPKLHLQKLFYDKDTFEGEIGINNELPHLLKQNINNLLRRFI